MERLPRRHAVRSTEAGWRVMNKLTDNDRRFGPLTWGKSSWNAIRAVFSTGGGIDECERNHLTIYAFGYVARITLPTRLKPWRQWVDTSHYNWSRGPGSGYWNVHAREYGFSLNEGFLQLFFGPQTHDSTTTKDWCKHLPWTQWRHVRKSLFDPNGNHFWTEWDRPRGFVFRDSFDARWAMEKACPAAVFEFDDHDGERIRAICRIEEREWRFGDGWFKWLSLFRKPMIRRCLDLAFSSEVGTDKGSWKGGTVGHSIDMLTGETPEQAFMRYCSQAHRAKNGGFSLRYVGDVDASQKGGAA